MNMSSLRRFLIISLLVMLPTRNVRADEEECVASDTCRHFGLIFDVQGFQNFSSLLSYHDGGYTGSLGFGVNFSRRFQLMIAVHTGSEKIPQGIMKPASGVLSLGGAEVQATIFFVEGASLRPYAACGYGLYTCLGAQQGIRGYNGGGPHVEAGVQWEISRYFALRTGVNYTRVRFFNPVGDGPPSSIFEPFTAHLLGPVLRVSFYPSVLP